MILRLHRVNLRLCNYAELHLPAVVRRLLCSFRWSFNINICDSARRKGREVRPSDERNGSLKSPLQPQVPGRASHQTRWNYYRPGAEATSTSASISAAACTGHAARRTRYSTSAGHMDPLGRNYSTPVIESFARMERAPTAIIPNHGERAVNPLLLVPSSVPQLREAEEGRSLRYWQYPCLGK